MEMLRHIARLHAHPLDLDALAERLGLGECGRTPYRRLSGGQQQRLGLAMAIVGRPEIVFVDEPTAGMDPQARRTTWELLEELRARRRDRRADDALHGGGRAARRPDPHHRPRPPDRLRHAAGAHPRRGRSAATIRLVVTEPFPPGAPSRCAARSAPRSR